MQKKFLKMTCIIGLILLFLLSVNLRATDDSITSNETTTSIPGIQEEIESEEEEHEDALGSTADDTNTTASTQNTTSATSTYTPKISQPTTSYSTVATIPEANLSLNNILNVILIAVGVILILLAIAILIRLK